jgi:hypothetical protein
MTTMNAAKMVASANQYEADLLCLLLSSPTVMS